MGRHRLPVDDPVAGAYLAWCRQQRVPENTIRRRRSVLRSLGNPGTATRDQVETWWTTRQHLANVTRANDLACLRGFYKWCQLWEHRPDDPTIRLRPPKAPQGAPKPITRKELDQILAHVQDQPQLRRAVLLGAWAGLRISEAAALSWTQIDPDSRIARIHGKGNKTRLVTFSTRLIDELLPDTGGNVVTGTARAWTSDTLGRKVNQAIAAAGVKGTYHKLRHRYGSIAYQRTKDPKAVAAQLGHASVSTTMTFYAAAADDAARAVADAVIDD